MVRGLALFGFLMGYHHANGLRLCDILMVLNTGFWGEAVSLKWGSGLSKSCPNEQ